MKALLDKIKESGKKILTSIKTWPKTVAGFFVQLGGKIAALSVKIGKVVADFTVNIAKNVASWAVGFGHATADKAKFVFYKVFSKSDAAKEYFASRPVKAKIVSLEAKKARYGWVFVAPFAVGLVFIYIPMVVRSIWFGTQDIIMGEDGLKYTYVGFKNFYDMLFVDSTFMPNLLSTLGSLAYTIPTLILFSLFVAVLLNGNMKGRTFFRAIFFLPVILATGIIAKVDGANNAAAAATAAISKVENDAAGISGQFDTQSLMFYLESIFSFSPALREFLLTAINGVYSIINNSGVQILVFLAGLQSISPALYEAASIEGCSAWESFWKITFPMISPMILTNLIYTIVDHCIRYDNPIMSFIESGMGLAQYGRMSAAGWLYCLVILAVVAILGGITSKLVFYQGKEK